MRRIPRLALGLVASFAFLGSARAQTSLAQAPTAGMTLPAPSVVTDLDATAISLNPAGIALLPSWSAVLAHTSGLDDDETTSGGDGLFLAFHALGPTALGLSLEEIRPSPLLAPGYGDHYRLSIAYAIAPTPTFSLGFAYHHFFDRAEPSAGLDGLTAWDAGAIWHGSAYLGFGLAVHDVTSEIVAGQPVEATFVPEVEVRPFGTDRIELGAGVAVGDVRHDSSPYGRLSLVPVEGVRLTAAIADPEIFLVGFAGQPTRRDLVATLALDVDFGGAGVEGAYLANGAGAARGVAGLLHLSGARTPGLLSEDRVDRFALAGALDDRQLVAIERALDEDAGDPDVRGVLLEINGLDTGWASIEELRDALHRLRATGKVAYAYVVEGATRDYYLAAACDRIYQSPAGGIRLVGLASTVMLFKDALDKLHVTADFVKIGAYKSAPEELTNDASSGPATEEREALLDDVYDNLAAGIAADRGSSSDAVKKLIDGGPYTAKEALDAHLVDALANPDELDEDVRNRLGVYPSDPDSRPRAHARWVRPRIAVVYIDGDIVDGKSQSVPLLGEDLTGGDTIVDTLDEIAMTHSADAVVLRVDSPGGSALASDLIDHEVQKLAEKGIPVVASMGNLAASGGYYVLADAREVFAEPSTITGSIGIFSGKFDVSGLAARLGVALESSKRGAHADEESLYRGYTDEERADLLKKLGYYYGRFVDAVARGRKLPATEVDALGRGRVWSGTRALANKLVDERGSFHDALEAAKRDAGLSPAAAIDLVSLPRQPSSFIGKLLDLFLGADESEGAEGAGLAALVAPPAWLRAAIALVPPALVFGSSRPLARLPYVLTIE